MVLRSKHNFFIYPFFKRYAVWIMERHFNAIKVLGEFDDKDLPVLLISNHVSWWDGFWAMYVNLKVFRRKFHFMMLEDQLRKFWFFNYTGGFSVNKKARSLIETLDYTAELLGNSKNMVLVFPQGEIQSMHVQTFQFEKGLERVLKNKDGKAQIVFVANLVDYFSEKKPSLYMYLKEFDSSDFNIHNLQDKYNEFYIESLEKQIKLKA